jgi:hypothetical protein
LLPVTSAEKFLIFPIVRGSFDVTVGTAIARLTGLKYVEFARGTAQCSAATFRFGAVHAFRAFMDFTQGETR